MVKQITLAGGISLSPITAGCMRLCSKKQKPGSIRRFVEQCLEMGVNTFDHAPVYGTYTAEAIFGDDVLLNNSALRDKIKIVTKTGIVLPKTAENRVIYYDSSPAWIRAEVDRSLQKLRTDHIDLLLIHRPDYLMDTGETGAILDDLVKSGKVLSLGVSNFTVGEFSALQSKMKIPLALNQIEFSAKTTDPLFNGLTSDAIERDIPLMVWSPLGGGSIFSSQDEQSLRLRKVLGELGEETGASAETLLYAWLLRLPLKIIPITGTTRIDGVHMAIKALDITLSHDQWYRVLAASRGYDVP